MAHSTNAGASGIRSETITVNLTASVHHTDPSVVWGATMTKALFFTALFPAGSFAAVSSLTSPRSEPAQEPAASRVPPTTLSLSSTAVRTTPRQSSGLPPIASRPPPALRQALLPTFQPRQRFSRWQKVLRLKLTVHVNQLVGMQDFPEHISRSNCAPKCMIFFTKHAGHQHLCPPASLRRRLRAIHRPEPLAISRFRN
jgi:hypothetical protein